MRWLTLKQACVEFTVTEKTLRAKVIKLSKENSPHVSLGKQGKISVWNISDEWLVGNYRPREKEGLEAEILKELRELKEQQVAIFKMLMQKERPTLLTSVYKLLSAPLNRKS